MPSPYCDIFRRNLRPLEPVPTGETPVLKRLAGIRAVLFDVYGTLFISASGEVGSDRQRAAQVAPPPQRALAEALKAVGIAGSGPGQAEGHDNALAMAGQGVRHLSERIEAWHAESRTAGIDHPEVDIVEIWRQVLAELARGGLLPQAGCEAADLKRLAVEYEARANPCWPMPHLPECLERLRRDGRVLGLVSNAQFYTPVLFEALLGRPAEQWGFEPDLQCYSYHYGRAKPGLDLFRPAVEALHARRIVPGETLYVGNDMLNDVFAAGRLGLRTALFAGDARSLRRREEDRRLEAVWPDLVLTDLIQLHNCI